MRNNHSYSHLTRLIIILTGVGVLFFVVRSCMVPKSFYESGHYRKDSVAEMAVPLPHYQGNEVCADCHFEKVYVRWMRSRHISVDCELCHGPGERHVSIAGGRNKFIDINKDQESCLVCHGVQVARRKSFPQIELKTHYERYKNVALDEKCVQCHNPHAPLEDIEKWTDARGEPL